MKGGEKSEQFFKNGMIVVAMHPALPSGNAGV